MSKRVLMVSSDCHAGIPHDAYRGYIEERYLGDFEDFEASLAAWSDWQQPFPEDATADREEVAARTSFFDSDARLKDLVDDGVVSEVLFPGASAATAVPWSDFLSAGSFRARNPRSRELQTAGERAYNRWLAEFCQAVPKDRRLGLAFLPFQDVDAAVKEAEWAAENGLRGVLMPFFHHDLPEYVHGWYWDRIWAVCEEAGLSLNFHGGYGGPEWGTHDALTAIEHLFWSRRPIWHLMFSGVFDRFPELKIACTESTAEWVPSTLAQLDSIYDGLMEARNYETVLFNDQHLPMKKPSEYWLENCFIGVSLVALPEMEMRHEIGVPTMMHGVDYPHPEGSWGQATTWLQASLGKVGATEEEARAILGLNAARLYHVDVEAMEPVVEQVGPTIDEVLTQASDEEVNQLLIEAAATKRTLASALYGGNTQPTI
jgi:predicted TIM-barrel fold metal-dependent hydrolase